jgi:beta-phosphoglucomutase-like phosphatase (HAD superfamily)
MFPATLLDYNGVLVDDERVHLEAFRDVLGPLGVELTEQDYWQRYLGYDDAGAFRAILADAGQQASDSFVAELIERKRPSYRRRAEQQLVGFPGAADLVRRRANVGPVVVVSGALRDEIELGLAVLGVSELVCDIVSAEDTERSKPDPEGFLIGVERLQSRLDGSAAREALVVEDSVAGVQAAKSASLACVAVAHSYDKVELERAGADEVVAHISALTDDKLTSLYRRLHG